MAERELLLDSEGITIRGSVLVPASGVSWPLVVLCHGIPSGAPTAGEPGYEVLARRLCDGGCAACYFNFRGTGLSGGNFSLPGWVTDLGVILAASGGAVGPFEGCDPERVALMGFSGGGAVSIICAARRLGLKGVATLSSPAEFTRLLPKQEMRGFIQHARSIGIIRDRDFPSSEEEYYMEMLDHNPIDAVGGIAPVPLLVVHGDMDDMVPVREAYRLYEAASEPKELYIVAGGGHKLRLNAEAMDRAVSWVSEKLESG